MLNLAMVLDDPGRKYPEREAIVSGATRLTYGQLHAMASQVAGGLRARGIRPGDRVALSCPNIAYFPIAYYGILKAGAVVVPLNVLLKGGEIAYHLQDSGARAYLCFEGTPELPMAEMGHQGAGQAPDCRDFIVLPKEMGAPSPVPGSLSFGELTRDQASSFATADRAPDDTAVILYTSGTTGRPKGAELTNSNMLTNAFVSRMMASKAVDQRQRQTILITLPLFHSYGQTVQMNANVLAGDRLVLVPRFDPKVVLDLMQKEKVTLFAGVPTMYWGLLHCAREHGIDTKPIAENLTLCNSGGAAMPVELLQEFERTFGVTILEGYGLSETSPTATFNQADLPRKVGSVGRAIFGTEVKVVDPEGKELPRNEMGEIVIRGHNVMKGYIGRPEATAEAIRDGWFHSGDLGRMDE
jgi:long-chain acyl-CoA synthetase